jgi:hypothetical protein
MRLLTLPVTIVRVPLELGFDAAKQAVKLVQGLVGGGEETVVEEPRPKPAPRRRPARRSTNGRSRTTKTATRKPPAEPPAPAEPRAPAAPAEPAHVSEEPELVAEAAEAGVEDGAGAEVAVDEPWPGYDDMQAADIEDRLVAEGAATAAAVSLYEASRKGRAAVLEAASRSMAG